MLKKILLIISTCTIFVVFSMYAKEPLNLSKAKKAVENYYNLGEYQYDTEQAIALAPLYLQYRIKHNPQHKKLAIVFDIDDTLLLNYAAGKKLDFGGTIAEIMQSLQTEKGTPILASQKLYNFAKQHKIVIFLITGRNPYMQKATVQSLQQAGYSGWTKLIFEPDNFKGKSVAVFKSAIRKQLEQQGYDIVLNVGDQYSDLKGGYADKTIKLPNPMYLVP